MYLKPRSGTLPVANGYGHTIKLQFNADVRLGLQRNFTEYSRIYGRTAITDFSRTYGRTAITEISRNIHGFTNVTELFENNHGGKRMIWRKWKVYSHFLHWFLVAANTYWTMNRDG